MRFAHIADTHIRNLKYHKEYRVVFSRLYDKLRELKVDAIVHCGDIAHTKTQISPEFVDLCSDFFRNMADIAPTYIILGNHDGNLKNSSRQDALTPIAKALEHPNLFLLKDSGEVSINDNFTLNVLSVFDDDNWVVPTDDSKVNIALYHGSISNCKTDTGWIMEHGENDISIFDRFDYAFLGDIHKTNQILDEEGRIRYCGSTVQQNHGETDDKGFLLWDIENKEKFSVEHYILENPKPFKSLYLTPKGRIPKKTVVKAGSRLRLVSENNLPLDVVRRAVDVAKHRFKPEAITYISRSSGERGSVENITKNLIKEDLRDIAVQEELISEYLKDFQIDDDTLKRIYDLNKRYSTIIEKEEEVGRNVNWKLKRLEWNNLFNYEEGNYVDFENLNGVVGIFGKNFSGKSSIIDSLLYTLYNTTSKNNRKNLNIINQNKKTGYGKVQIDIGTNSYFVERISEKYDKKLKGKVTTEAKTDLKFYKRDNAIGVEESLNGLSRNDTDKNIRKVFGTIEDFLLTSMASQLGSLTYISEGSTRRKEILAKFLDLELFEKKFKKAKEDSVDLKSSLRRLENKDFKADIKIARDQLAKNDLFLNRKEKECQKYKEDVGLIKEKLSEIINKVDSIPTEIINIHKVNKEIEEIKEKVSLYKKNNKDHKNELKESKEFLEKIENFLLEFPLESVKKDKEEIDETRSKKEEVEAELDKILALAKTQKNKISLLQEVPCGSEYSHCKFISDAYKASEGLEKTEISIEALSITKSSLQDKIKNLDPDKVDKRLDKYKQVLEKKSTILNDITSCDLKIEKNKTSIVQFGSRLQILESKKTQYEENKEAIENLEQLLKEKDKIEKEIKIFEKEYERCQRETMDLYKVHGSLEQRLKQIHEEEEEYGHLQGQYSAYDLFMQCMHPNGISYDIIKKRLPIINDEVSKVLANIVDFEILFVSDEKKLDILIKHPGYAPRPIEMGSGAEKTICAMAIRLALLNVSTLPKGDIFILDEPGTALDEENMEGFIRILDMIRNQFKTVILISHLESLKDTVDTQITIENVNGYAQVKH